jgi:electron transfer flavoprotein alpha subunit
VLVVGRWHDGAPDAATAKVLAALGGLGASAWGVDISPHDGEPGVAEAVADLVEAHGISLVALAGGTTSEDLAGRVAAASAAVLALDARGIELTPEGLRVQRPAYGGAFDAEVEVRRPQVLVASLDPASAAGDRPPARPLDLRGMHPLEITPGAVRLVERRHDDRELPLGRARRVVAGGRGIGGPEGFVELGALAEALGASLAASRPPCDAGWVPGHHQVGITGARVAPELYVAIGISGSVQHRAGMQSSQTVVAINNDPEAPMLHHADLAVLGDWREVAAGMLEVLAGAGAGPGGSAPRDDTVGAEP